MARQETRLLLDEHDPRSSTDVDIQYDTDNDIDFDDEDPAAFPPVTARTNSLSFSSSTLETALVSSVVETPLKHAQDEPPPDMWHEMRTLWQLVLPISATYMLEYTPRFVCIVLVGHLDSPFTKQYVAAATMSTMITNITGLSIAFGLLSALDTLFAQAYGAGRIKKMGIYVQSALLVVGACLVPIFLLNWHCETLLLWAGQDADVARFAGEFSRYTVFGVPALILYEIMRKLLQTQHIVNPFVVITVVGNVVNVVGGYYFTYHTAMGFHGAALARSLGYAVPCLLVVPYVWVTGNHTLWWPGWNVKAAWKHVGIFLSLGLPGLFMVAMNWWAFEVLAIMAGLLPDSVVSLSAHTVLMNVAGALFTVFVGVSVAVNIRVGTCLGANLPQKARLNSKIAVLLSFVLSSALSALVWLYRFQIPTVFINDSASVHRAATALLILIPYELIDGANGVMKGVCRGTGQQDLAAKVCAIAFYVVGLPVAALLCFGAQWGVEGLWAGFGTGNFIFLTTCSVILARTDWQALADEAQRRTAH